ncbi:hypothetical protein [Pseudooceanicola sp.]|uniref:hypothetical protein n=1 Tax=Pseudooceanicola sp. TaxID=1914328 RepID=UPI0040581B40
MHLNWIVLGLALTAAGAAGAQAPDEDDVDAREPADIEIPKGEVVERVIPDPAGDEDATAQVEEERPRDPVPDPSQEMFDDVQAVIASARSKTPMPDDPLDHLDAESEVHVLPVSTLEGTEAFHALPLSEVLRENREILEEARDQIRQNIYVNRALESAGYTLADVVTWETAGTDDVTIVVDDLTPGD